MNDAYSGNSSKCEILLLFNQQIKRSGESVFKSLRIDYTGFSERTIFFISFHLIIHLRRVALQQVDFQGVLRKKHLISI